MICPFCKEEIKDGAIKCKHCGTTLSSTETANNLPNQKKSYKGFLIALGLAIVVGVLIYFFAMKSNSGMEKHKDANEYYLSGLNKFKFKDYSGAIQDFNKVIELVPNYAEAYYFRGSAKIEIGDKNSACLDFRKADDLGVALANDAIELYCN